MLKSASSRLKNMWKPANRAGASHHHSHDEKYHIHADLHEGATVVSGSLTLTDNLDCVQEKISNMLEHIAALILESGGIIGHIKASAARRQNTLFSVTKQTVAVTPCDCETLELCVTVIAFSVTPDVVQSWLCDALEKLEKGE